MTTPPRPRHEVFSAPNQYETQMAGLRERFWIGAFNAALTGLSAKLYPSELIGDAGERRIRELAGAAALIANRAVQEYSLHFPSEPMPEERLA